ncbi:MAG: hypothetical protein E6J90_11250 [Deltaproteobacteria bacterium]|nr:MAG: hypothetical protein E6J90_11250 [Deltaproteobacteria bacterium]
MPIDKDPSAAAPEPGDPGEPAGDEAAGRAAVAGEPVDTRGHRIAGAAKDALGEGVSRLGEGVSRLGEGVSRLGDMSRIPVVGSGVAKLGEGITHVGEQLHVLPQVARTRRGRLLIRSVIVGFILVAAWITVIVALQLHGNDTPDFRPIAERVLVDLGKGAIDEVYEQASPRFQEMVRKERFSDDMTDLAETVGKFREITAVNDSLVTTGPTGRIGRVSLTVAYTKATCKVSVSLHNDQGRWKLLGIGVELPPELKISQAQREERVKACKDPMDIKRCDVHQAADAILHKLNDGHADQIWDDATAVFQKQEQKAKFVQLQVEHLAALGPYRRIIAVTEAKVIGGTSATFDTLAEFEKASGVRTVFGFFRRSRLEPWKLRSFKIVLPMPRAAEDTTAPPAPGTAPPAPPSRLVPRDAGAR